MALAGLASIAWAAGASFPGSAAAEAPEPVTHAPAAAVNFQPLSVTFVSLRTGWALGAVPCAGPGACLALEKTTNGGTSWTAQALPPALLAQADRKAYDGTPALLDGDLLPALNVRFASPRDGWIFGNVPTASSAMGVVWSTHDGGLTWHQLHPMGTGNVAFPLLDLEAMGGTAYLMGINAHYTVTVASTPAARDGWRVDRAPGLPLPAGGANAQGSFIFQGGQGWLVEGNDRGITGSAKLVAPGQWEAWSPPCKAVGDSYTVPAAANANDLVALCVMGGYAFPLSSHAPPGATIGSTWLYVSGDGGANFSAGPELSKQIGGVAYGPALASPSPGVVLAGRSITTNELAASFDGGRQWGVVYRGLCFYLGFTSPSQGVGLVLTSPLNSVARTAMVMTFDGGHRWSRVRF